MLAVALACLLVVALIGATMVQSLLTQHRQATRRNDQIQALWLAESAIDRAAVRLAGDVKYVGETWHIPAAALADRGPGRVEIRVFATESTAMRRVLIETFFPDLESQRVMHRVEVHLPIPASGASS